jgi:hypothetical protein
MMMMQHVVENIQNKYVALTEKLYKTKNTHNEVFHVYGGKCLSRKTIHNLCCKFDE